VISRPPAVVPFPAAGDSLSTAQTDLPVSVVAE